MGLKSLIQIAAVLAILAVSTGRLPQILRVVRVAQLHMVKESMTTNWGRAMLLQPGK